MDERRPMGQVKFAQQAGAMLVDGLHADEQGIGNMPVGLSFGNHRQNLQLPIRQ